MTSPLREAAAQVSSRVKLPSPTGWVRSLGFPYVGSATPRGVEPAAERETLGDFYETEWARSPLARWSRIGAIETVGRAVVTATCRPQARNLDRLEDLDGPAIFVANHHSHLDTTLLLTSIPMPWRHELVVAAAADYFFDKKAKAALAGWAYGAIPMERKKISRRSAGRAAALLEDGWSLLIFPEGGRSPEGWGQVHKGGAAYLSVKLGVPVVPIHINDTGRVLPKGSKRIHPHSVVINFGKPVLPAESDDARSFVSKIESAIAGLADETATDWWSALQRSSSDGSPSLRGPDLDSWRRDWSSPDRATRRPTKLRWPDLGD